MAITQETHWDNVGTEPGAGDAEYVAGQQPIAEHDNWFNWSAAKDVENLITALENITTGHDHDGTNSKQVDGSDVVNTPAGNIVATDVQAALNELDAEKETPTGAQTKVNTHAAISTDIHGVGVGNSVASDDDIATHAADTSTHGVTGDILGTEDKDVVNGIAGLDAAAKIIARLSYEGVANGVAGLDASTLLIDALLATNICRIARGTYTGNNGANRAIAHTLAGTPILHWVTCDNATYMFIRGHSQPSGCTLSDAADVNYQTATVPDATNFYVGGGDVDYMCNRSPNTYHWGAVF